LKVTQVEQCESPELTYVIAPPEQGKSSAGRAARRPRHASRSK
jgi:hypothetical protein